MWGATLSKPRQHNGSQRRAACSLVATTIALATVALATIALFAATVTTLLVAVRSTVLAWTRTTKVAVLILLFLAVIPLVLGKLSTLFTQLG